MFATTPLHRRLSALLALLVILPLLLAGGCTARPADLDSTVRHATRGRRFSIARWELQQLVPGKRGARVAKGAASDAQVRAYLALVARLQEVEREEERLLAAMPEGDAAALAQVRAERDTLIARRDALRPTVQRILMGQVRAAYHAAGIYNPADRLYKVRVSFPPMAFTLDAPPHLLVISPRDRIASVREVLLSPTLSSEEMEAIEDAIEAQGYSALVTGIGGLGATYPTFVQESTDLRWLTGVIAEEWLHQYLAFTPVGWRYVLDRLKLRPDEDIARLNEGAATIVSEEIALAVLADHYPEYLPQPTDEATPAEESQGQEEAEQGFVFNREMRLTRLHVDELLAAGQVKEAEAYMEQRRQLFVANGYALRKLNQAYFAFHGNYAVPSSQQEPLPAELVDPLGAQLQQLRAQSASLGAFLDTVAGLRSAQDLADALDE